MTGHLYGRLARPLVGVALAGMLSVASAAPSFAAGAFDGLEGSWSGGGSIKMENGSSERIRCRVRYNVSGGGNSVTQDLRCASDSYTFNLSANIRASGSSISGNWSETSRGVGGNVVGTVNAGSIRAVAEGSSFSVNLSVNTRGNSQSVSIRVSRSEVREVSMTLRKGN